MLLFSPNAFIDVHAIPEAILAQSLANHGHEIIQIGCSRFYDYCVSMSAASVWEGDSDIKKSEICERCQLKKNELNARFKFNHHDLNKFYQYSE